ncbi:phosphoglucomutase/phosphomannomutase, alpha/beta/alpha domain I [Ostertagia ostertagi]
MNLAEHLAASVEILYSQKGSRAHTSMESADGSFLINKYNIRLDYAEVPIQLNYFDRRRSHFGAGIRGTIGGTPGNGLTPIDIVRFTTAYGEWVKQRGNGNKIVVGRDGRISGEVVRNLVVATLQSLAFDVIDLGLSTTPTVEMAVTWEQAAGGIILTASHNPKEWNALKLLNEKGEFISAEDGAWILDNAENGEKLK